MAGKITLELGATRVSLTPHYFPDVGPRVIVEMSDPWANLSPELLRLYADAQKLAACEAEALERRALRKRSCLTRAA